jgi:hypothetical protein
MGKRFPYAMLEAPIEAVSACALRDSLRILKVNPPRSGGRTAGRQRPTKEACSCCIGVLTNVHGA